MTTGNKLDAIQAKTTNPIILAAITACRPDVRHSVKVSQAIMAREKELGADVVDAADEELTDIRIELFGCYE